MHKADEVALSSATLDQSTRIVVLPPPTWKHLLPKISKPTSLAALRKSIYKIPSGELVEKWWDMIKISLDDVGRLMLNRLTNLLMIYCHCSCGQSIFDSSLPPHSLLPWSMAIKPFIWLKRTSSMLGWLWCNAVWLTNGQAIPWAFTFALPSPWNSCQTKLLQGCLHWTLGKWKARYFCTPSLCLFMVPKTIFPYVQFPMIEAGTSLGMQQRRLSLWSQMLSLIRIMPCSFTLKTCMKTNVSHPHQSTTRKTHPIICAWWKSFFQYRSIDSTIGRFAS